MKNEYTYNRPLSYKMAREVPQCHINITMLLVMFTHLLYVITLYGVLSYVEQKLAQHNKQILIRYKQNKFRISPSLGSRTKFTAVFHSPLSKAAPMRCVGTEPLPKR
jgi:hypothetical protein